MERLRVNATEQEAILSQLALQLKSCDNISNFKPDFAKMLDEKEIIKPMVLIPSDIWIKMYSLVQNTDKEISWHGLVKRDEEYQIYTIYDILLFPQINTATATQTDDDKYSEWLLSKMTDPEFPFEDMRMHGHSHVKMNVYSSGIDDAYQKELLTKVEDGDYYLFFVLNQKFEMFTLLYDFKQNVLFKNADITIRVVDTNGENIQNWSKKQIEEYVTIPKPAVFNYNTKRGKRYGSK